MLHYAAWLLCHTTSHVTRGTLHGTRYTLHGTHYTLHSTRYTLHGTRYMSRDARYTLHVTLYTLYVAHCIVANATLLDTWLTQTQSRATFLQTLRTHIEGRGLFRAW